MDSLSEVLDRIEHRLKVVGISATAASKMAGLSADAIRNIRRAVREPDKKGSPARTGISTATLNALAPVLKTSPDWLLSARGAEHPLQAPNHDDTVPLVGVVGAGAAMLLFEYGQHDPGERVTAPEGATDKTVAAEIRGASLGELFDRWLVYYDEIRDPPTYDLVNKLCVLGLADGRVVVKKLRRGSAPGLWTLLSNNDKPIEDVGVLWAAKVKQMSPR